MQPASLIPKEAEEIIAAPGDASVDMERELLEETENGWMEGDPLDQPDNPEEARTEEPGEQGPVPIPKGAVTAAQVVAVADREVGVVEQPTNCTKYGAWYGLDGQPWCAMFVSWCFDQAGAAPLVAASTAKGFAFCPAGAQWFEGGGRWGTSPQVGAVAFFRFSGGPPRIHHVALVTGVNPDGSIDTIEGNTSRGAAGSQRDGGGVWRRRRKTGIVGYGYPAYQGVSEPAFSDADPTDHAEIVRQLQRLIGTAADGDFGPKTAAACDAHPVGWQTEVDRRSARGRRMENRRDIVEWLQRQGNRRGFPLAVDGDVGPATNHWIVVGLGRSTAICDAEGFRAACT